LRDLTHVGITTSSAGDDLGGQANASGWTITWPSASARRRSLPSSVASQRPRGSRIQADRFLSDW